MKIEEIILRYPKLSKETLKELAAAKRALLGGKE
jgi:hypothetical protein